MGTVTVLHSVTSGNKPTSQVTGQIAINEADRKVYYLDPFTSAPGSLLDQLEALSASENMLFNPGMEVDQEHVGVAVTGVTNQSKYIVDGCEIVSSSATAVFTIQQVTDAPPGYYASAKVSVTTAEASLATSEGAHLSMPIEGYISQKLQWGTASASSVVVGFWFKANRTGQYGGRLNNSANNQYYPYSFTYNTSATWQYVSFVVPGPTSGTFATGNSAGIWFSVCMAAASNLLATAGAWVSGGPFESGTGQINGIAATTDYMQVTGVMIHRGYVPVPQERAPYMMPKFSDALLACYRYWEKSYGYETAVGTTGDTGPFGIIVGGQSSATRSGGFTIKYRTKRNAPTITVYSGNSGTSGKMFDASAGQDLNASVTANHNQAALINATTTTAGTVLNLQAQWTADSRL